MREMHLFGRGRGEVQTRRQLRSVQSARLHFARSTEAYSVELSNRGSRRQGRDDHRQGDNFIPLRVLEFHDELDILEPFSPNKVQRVLRMTKVMRQVGAGSPTIFEANEHFVL